METWHYQEREKSCIYIKKNCSEFQTQISSVFVIDISIDSLHKHSVHICYKCVRKIKNISRIASPVSIIRSAHNHAAQISHIWVDFEPDNLECTLCLRHKSLISGFLVKRVRTTHSDNTNVTHTVITPHRYSHHCLVDLSTAEGFIHFSD